MLLDRQWLGEETLEDRFPQIFGILRYKDISVKEAFREFGGRMECHVNVMRNLNGWEVCNYESLL